MSLVESADNYPDIEAHPDSQKHLWCAVIAQAFNDAVSFDRSPEARKEKSVAREWLLSESQEFIQACNLAGLDPDAVRERAAVLIAKVDANPDAVRWSGSRRAPRARSKSVRLYEINGVERSLPEWAKVYGLRVVTLHKRLSQGMTLEDALKQPVRRWRAVASKGGAWSRTSRMVNRPALLPPRSIRRNWKSHDRPDHPRRPEKPYADHGRGR